MPDPHRIPPSEIKKLRDAFEKEKGPALDQINANNPNCQWDKDARYTTYKIDDLKSYLDYLKNDLNQTEVKVCLGQYDKKTCPPGKPEYNGLTTIIFVPEKPGGGSTMMRSSTETSTEDSGEEDGLNRGGTGIPPGGQ